MQTAINITLASIIFVVGFLSAGVLLAENVIAEYDIPANSSGLAWDGDLFWIGGVGDAGDWIRALDPESGQIVDSIEAPEDDCIGLAFYQGRLAYISPRSDRTYFVGRNGYEVAFDNPLENLGGLGVDGDYFWSATYSEERGTLIQMNADGDVIRSMPYNGRHSRETAFLRGKVYVADRLEHEIRVVNPETGRFIRTFHTPTSNPDGLTSDGTFLYLIDDGDEKSTDKLYKLSVPQQGGIRLSALAHDYGSVIIDDEKDWSLWIYNDGARETDIPDYRVIAGSDDIFVPHLWNLGPIASGDSAELRITFSPAYVGPEHLIFSLTYDLDRVSHEITLTGKGVYQRRDMVIEQRFIDFGDTRCGRYINTSNMRHLIIENNGGDPLTIEALEFSDESFYYGIWDFPHTFYEPGIYKIPLFFRPVENNNIGYNETVTIISDAPRNEGIAVVNLIGQSRLSNYYGGTPLWEVTVGDYDHPGDLVRSVQDIDDVSGDNIGDVIIASNDYLIRAYHAASTNIGFPIWSYSTDINPWRKGLVAGQRGMSEGDDWDDDGVRDIVFGLEGDARQIITLSGRTGVPIWMFDTHGLPGGGGDIIVTLGGVDYNRDGVFDVMAAIVNEGDDNTTKGVILLDGVDGNIIWRFPTEASPMDIHSIRDFTGDGVNDIIAVLTNGMLIGIDGRRGQSTWSTEIDGRIQDTTPTLGDVNGDGSADFCLVTHSRVIMINGSNGVELWEWDIYDDLSHIIAVNDYNDNGSPDIVYTDDSAARALDGLTGEAVWDTSYMVNTHTGDLTSIQDFDHDGKMDLVLGTRTGRVLAYSGDGRNGLWSLNNPQEGRDVKIVISSRDVDGNGRDDVFAALLNGKIICIAGAWIGDIDTSESAPMDPDFPAIPQALMVDPAYPNPFNMSVVVPFHLRQPGVMNFAVMNILGREVFSQRSELLPVGSHNFLWQGESGSGAIMPSGSYFIELSTGRNRTVLHVNLIK